MLPCRVSEKDHCAIIVSLARDEKFDKGLFIENALSRISPLFFSLLKKVCVKAAPSKPSSRRGAGPSFRAVKSGRTCMCFQ